MTSAIPAVVENHLDAISCASDGRIIIASSNLTGRYWNGSLWCFPNVHDAPDVEKCLTGIEVASGICDLVHFNENKVALGLDSGSLDVYKLDSEPVLFTWMFGACEHDDFISSLSLNSNKSSLITAGADHCVKIWDVETWSTYATYRPVHAGIIWQVSNSTEDPHLFVTCGQDAKILLFDTRLPKPATLIDNNPLKGEVTSVAWKPCSANSFAAGDESGQIVIKDIRTNNSLCSFYSHKRRIFRLLFSCSGSWLASCADDTAVCLMDVEKENPDLIYRDDSHQDFIRGMTWSPENHLITCGWDKKVIKHVFDINVSC
ncbi:Methylosome protein 50, partial [Stegodyphus mimosarum]